LSFHSNGIRNLLYGNAKKVLQSVNKGSSKNCNYLSFVRIAKYKT
jgi:hypothetical protein